MGVVAGLMSGFFGIGGGVVLVPLLILVAGLDQRRAAATSLLAIAPTALAGTLGYGARGEVDVAAGLLVGAGGVAGALLGARALRRLPIGVLRWMFVALLVAVASSLFVDVPLRSERVELGAGSAAAYVALGVFVGLASALFGIGGGVIAVPALMGLFGVPMLVAKGTSLLTMLPTSVAGSVPQLRRRLVDPGFAAVVGAGAVAGSFGGVAVAHAVGPRASNALFAALLLYCAARLAWRAARRHAA